jgi:tRNA U34 5-methylaminomethyl-2-thiouridine-forming methyltransferase MnmC
MGSQEQGRAERDGRPGWIPQPTGDGSFTFFSEEFGEAFHSRQGAKAEAIQKFAHTTQLAQRAVRGDVRILDICYGLGYNTAAALETVWAVNPDCAIHAIGLELDATVPQGAIAPPLLADWSPRVQTVLRAIAQDHQYRHPPLNLQLWIGDARQTIQATVESGFQADAIFLDPFSPRRCPQLWTVEFLQQVAQCLSPDGILATYSRSACVRAALIAAGLAIGTLPMAEAVPLPHEWAQGTLAKHTPQGLLPLSPMEQEHLATRAAIPYRDPTLTATAEEILVRHQQEQQNCQRESTSSWRRRWGIQ